jgi:MFS family permease
VSTFAPLRHRSFATLWVASFVSNVGTWMGNVGLGYHVASTTGRATWTAVIAAAGFLPAAVLGPIGGALADRLDRRLVLTATNLASAVVLASMALAVANDLDVGVLAILSLAGGASGAIGFPVYQSMIPDLVPNELLVSAVGLGSAQFNLGRVIGPVIAGVTIDLAGVEAALVIDSVTFLAVVIGLALVRVPGPRHGDRVSIRRSIATGARALHADEALWSTFRVMSLALLVTSAFIGLVSFMATDVLDGDERTTSILVTAQGGGAVVGALSIGRLTESFGRHRMFVGALWALPVALVLYGSAPNVWAMAPALALVGACYLLVINSCIAMSQLRAAPEVRGRVVSLFIAMLGALFPISAFVQGRLADDVGLRAVTIGSGVVFAAVIAGLTALRPKLLDAIG